MVIKNASAVYSNKAKLFCIISLLHIVTM